MNYRKTGPIGAAPAGPSGMSQSKPQIAKSTATPLPADQTGTNTKTKDTSPFPTVGPLGARGHGGAD